MRRPTLLISFTGGEALWRSTKKHDEFHILNMNSGWETPRGYPKGTEQKILSGALDETNKRGTRTRLLRFAPGVFATEPFVHEYWEEVYLVSGDLTVGTMSTETAATPFRPTLTHAGRPAPITARSGRTAAACCWKPLLRSGLNNTGEPPSARLFFVEPHAACNLDALRLRRASAMQAFRQVAHGVAADRHVLN